MYMVNYNNDYCCYDVGYFSVSMVVVPMAVPPGLFASCISRLVAIIAAPDSCMGASGVLTDYPLTPEDLWGGSQQADPADNQR